MERDTDTIFIIAAVYCGCILALAVWHYFGPEKLESVVYMPYPVENLKKEEVL